MDISALFWIVIIAMAIAAVGFVASPLWKSSGKPMLIVIAIAVPLSAAALYALLGSPAADSAGQRPAVATTTRMNTPNEAIGSVASMLEGLENRLQENPEDGGSWLLLARSYKHLNRTDDAINAYEHAAALGQIDAELAELAKPESQNSEADSNVAGIYGNVQLAAEVSSVVEPTDTVFIFAKAVNGPPAPLAILQRPASELPIDFLLNDSQSMIAGMKLSDFEEVIVTARITRGGDATVALRGLEAKSESIQVAENRHLNLIIK